jgi:ATP dependent DNA ligase domain
MLSHPRALPAGFIAPCLPTSAPLPPSGESWLHEIKHDGFRVIARKAGERVRLYSRSGNDLTYRFRSLSRRWPSCARGPASSMVRPWRVFAPPPEKSAAFLPGPQRPASARTCRPATLRSRATVSRFLLRAPHSRFGPQGCPCWGSSMTGKPRRGGRCAFSRGGGGKTGL